MVVSVDTAEVPVSEGTRIFVNFSLSLEDGSEIDSNFDSDPVSFIYGDGSLLPGFEHLMLGMEAGQRSMFTVLPEDAFGQPNDNNVQQMPRDQFDDDVNLEIGMVFSFADAAGGELPGMLLSFDEDEVAVDFNHPLAGRKILFDVAVHRVEPAEIH